MTDKLNEIKYTIKTKIKSLMPWTDESATLFESWLEAYRVKAEKELGLNILVQVGKMGSGLVLVSISFYRGAVVDACFDCFLTGEGVSSY